MKTMNKFLALSLFALLMGGLAFGQINMPQASPSVTVKQAFGISEVTLNYSRPGMKGRKVYGELVPFGEVWRTGANNSTTLEFADEVTIEGNAVPAGKYSLFTIPGKDEWTVILNKSVGWGVAYDQQQDLVRFKVKPQKSPTKYETFTIDFANFTNEGVDLQIKWEETLVNVTITSDVDSKVMAQIDRVMANPESSLAGVYFQSASYYFETGKDLDKALKWVDKALEYNPDPFWVIRLKSRIQAGLKDYKGAIETAKLSLEKATAAGNNDYVKLNNDSISEWEKML